MRARDLFGAMLVTVGLFGCGSSSPTPADDGGSTQDAPEAPVCGGEREACTADSDCCDGVCDLAVSECYCESCAGWFATGGEMGYPCGGTPAESDANELVACGQTSCVDACPSLASNPPALDASDTCRSCVAANCGDAVLACSRT